MPVDIPYISLIQLFLIEFTSDKMNTRIIHIIKYSIIVKWHKHTFINGIF